VSACATATLAAVVVVAVPHKVATIVLSAAAQAAAVVVVAVVAAGTYHQGGSALCAHVLDRARWTRNEADRSLRAPQLKGWRLVGGKNCRHSAK
jgi:hypothetical protein